MTRPPFPYNEEPRQEFEDQTPDSSNPADTEDAQKRAIFEREQEETFWRNVMADPVGRRVMWRMLSGLNTFLGTTFAASPAGFPDQLASGFHIGQREIGLALHADLLRWAPDGVLKMHQEKDPRYQRPVPKMRTDDAQ